MLIPQKAYCPVRVKWAIWLNSHHNVELFPHYRVVSHSAWLHSACILFESSHSLHSISASGLRDTWKLTHVFGKSDTQRFLAVGGEWAPVFVLQIIFLLGFSKIFEDVLRKSLKSYQIKSAQSDNWLYAVFRENWQNFSELLYAVIAYLYRFHWCVLTQRRDFLR